MIFKSDNGGEFTSNEVKEYLNNANIKHETTSPYTPFQNGIAERSNRTIFECALATMIPAQVKPFLWTYAVFF